MTSANASTFLNFVAGAQPAAGHKHAGKGQAADGFAALLGAKTEDGAQAGGVVDPALLTLHPAPPPVKPAGVLTGLTKGETATEDTQGAGEAAKAALAEANGAATGTEAGATAKTTAIASLLSHRLGRAHTAAAPDAAATGDASTEATTTPDGASVAGQLVSLVQPTPTQVAPTLAAPGAPSAATPGAEIDPTAITAQPGGAQPAGAKAAHGGHTAQKTAPQAASAAAAQANAQASATATNASAAAADIKIDATASSSSTSTSLPDVSATAHTSSSTSTSQAAQTNPALQSAPPATIQIYTRMIERMDGRAQRFEVRLDPAELGRVDVRIEVGADKKVHAVLAAHDSAALTDLMRGQRALERAFSDAGIDLADGGIRFELSSDTGRNLAGNQQREQHANASLAHAWRGFDTVAMPVEAETIAAVRPQWRPARLDLVA